MRTYFHNCAFSLFERDLQYFILCIEVHSIVVHICSVDAFHCYMASTYVIFLYIIGIFQHVVWPEI